MVNPSATEPGKAEDQGCIVWVITSSSLRAECGAFPPVFCPMPVSQSSVTSEDCAPWGTVRQSQAVTQGRCGESAPGDECPLGWNRDYSLIRSPALEHNLALAH